MRVWIIFGIIILVFGFSYFSVLRSFDSESAVSESVLEFEKFTPESDHAQISLTVVAVEPAKKSMTLRLDLKPQGSLSTDGGNTPVHDLKLYTNSLTGGSLRLFPKGKPIAATEITVELEDGDFADYPFDNYESSVVLTMTKGGDADETIIPAVVHFKDTVHGFDVDARKNPEVPKNEIDFLVSIGRSANSTAISYAIMGIMALLTLLVLFVISTTIIQRRKIEFSLFGWLGGLLFAFPAIRNAFPGSPPMGCLADFLVFFWAEGIIACMVLVVGSFWFLRGERPKTE